MAWGDVCNEGETSPINKAGGPLTLYSEKVFELIHFILYFQCYSTLESDEGRGRLSPSNCFDKLTIVYFHRNLMENKRN
jgi:hypothetical protein